MRQSGPPDQLRSVLRLLQPFDGLLLHLPSAPFDAVTLLGFSLQGFPLSNRPRSSSLPGYPLDVLPSGLRTLLLVRREPWARSSVPRMDHQLRLLSPTGFSSVRESVLCGTTVKFFRQSIPSWASSSLGFFRHEAEGFSPPPSSCFSAYCFDRPPCGFRPIQTTAASRRPDFAPVPVSLETGPPSKVSRLPDTELCGVTRFGLITLRFSPRAPVHVTVP